MNFSEYLITVAGGAALGIVADIFTEAFSGRRRGVEKYINFGITVCIVSCMLLPLTKLFGKGYEIFPQNTFSDAYGATSASDDSLYILERECEEKLSEKIQLEAGINVSGICIEMKKEGDNPVIESAVIELFPEDSGKLSLVEEIASVALGAKPCVRINGTEYKTDDALKSSLE